MGHTLYLSFRDLLRFETGIRSGARRVVVVGPEETKLYLAWQVPQERP